MPLTAEAQHKAADIYESKKKKKGEATGETDRCSSGQLGILLLGLELVLRLFQKLSARVSFGITPPGQRTQFSCLLGEGHRSTARALT